MSDSSSEMRATIDQILRLREALHARYPSDPHGVQEALDQLRLRATALGATGDPDAHEAIELEFYTLVESAPEVRRVFRSLRDAETAEVLLRAIEDLQRIRQERPLTQRELETLRDAQSFYDDVTHGEDDKGSE